MLSMGWYAREVEKCCVRMTHFFSISKERAVIQRGVSFIDADA